MKNIKEYILEQELEQFKIQVDEEKLPEGDFFLLNKSGIKGNKKLEKIAKQGGVKYKGEWWFVSIGNCFGGTTEEVCKNTKNEPRLKDNPDFEVANCNDFENNYIMKK